MSLKLAFIVGITALVAGCFTAPVHENHSVGLLSRPAPINPDIPVEPKPEEKITMITDPKEVAKIKRDAQMQEATTSAKPVVLLGPIKATDLLNADLANNHHDLTPLNALPQKRNSEQLSAEHSLTRIHPVPVAELFARRSHPQ